MPQLLRTSVATVMAVNPQTCMPDRVCGHFTAPSPAHLVSSFQFTPGRKPRSFVRTWSPNLSSVVGRRRVERLRRRPSVVSDGGAGEMSERTGDLQAILHEGEKNAGDLETLRSALAAAEGRAEVLEKARGDAVEAMVQAEAKAQHYGATMMENSEKATADVEAAKVSFKTKMEDMLREKAALESALRIAKREAIDLALKVEMITEQAVLGATSQLADEANMRLTAAEATAADAVLQVEERIRKAADEAATYVVMESKAAIEDATKAAAKAMENAEKAQAALVEKWAVFDKLAIAEATIASLQETGFTLERKLKLATTEANNLRLELTTAETRAHSAETRLASVEAALAELKEDADRQSSEREEKTRLALEALKEVAEAKEEAAKATFQMDSEAREAASIAALKAGKIQEEAFRRRCEALERSLKAGEASAAAWRARATAVEGILENIKEEGGEKPGIVLGGEGLLSAGRLDTALGDDSKKWELLANGPRRETPEWMKRRIESGLQGLPPRENKAIDAVVEAEIPLELPAPDEVWSIANAKVKTDDLFTKQAAEQEAINSQREALDSQRKALERALQKKGVKKSKTPEEADIKQEPGTGSGREVVLQGFNWESWRRKWYLELAPRAADLAHSGITAIWLPPPTQSVSPQGYMPSDLYDLNSAYGTLDELKFCIQEMHNHDMLVLGDVVLNHRCAQKQGADGIWNIFGGKLAWGPDAIVRDDPNFRGQGNPSTGDFFHAAPNIDHAQTFVRKDIKEWMKWLRTEIGYDGWRLDFVRGFWGGYVKEYVEATEPVFAIGEYWDSLGYEGGNVCYNQDPHRQRIINWINATGGSSSAFDVTTKGILHSALHNEYWRLIDPQGKPPGVVGWWPSRAVTFLENHDTGSTQGHWPFPRDKLMQGYAYILTHPGTPVVFYDHFYDFGLHDPIAELIAARTRTGVHCRSPIKILHANNDGYVARVGENLVVKLGRLDWNPSKQNNLVGSWQRFVDKGSDYQLWERT